MNRLKRKPYVERSYITNNYAMYANNFIDEELLRKVRNTIALTDEPVMVSFEVMGQTKHITLSNELANKLTSKYKVEINGYECLVCSA